MSGFVFMAQSGLSVHTFQELDTSENWDFTSHFASATQTYMITSEGFIYLWLRQLPVSHENHAETGDAE